jgi:phosphoribosyl-dephospho-CoA transferase
MDEKWCDLTLPWGPTGSVGFELASGRRSTNEWSDLDLVIRTPARISRERARSLWNQTKRLAVRVDVRVETPHCGFSLEEYACWSSDRILLRYPDGPKLGADPWSEP